MRKSGPGKGIDLLNVVQEFDQLEGSRADLLDLVGLLDGVEIVAHMVDAASRGRDDVVEAGEVAHEQRLGLRRLGVEPAIRHRLPAARLVARIHDLVAETLEQLEGRDAYFGKEGIDVARDEETDAHTKLLRKDARR